MGLIKLSLGAHLRIQRDTGYRGSAWYGAQSKHSISGHFYLYYYHFITSMGPLIFTLLGILAHNPAVRSSTWHRPNLASEGFGDFASLIFPFGVPSPQDYSVTIALRWLLHDSLSPWNHKRCPHCCLCLSPPIYLSAHTIWLFLPMVCRECCH